MVLLVVLVMVPVVSPTTAINAMVTD
jgi:hypothetical protein